MRAAGALVVAATLAGCAAGPRGPSSIFGGSPTPERDGPGANPPPDLAQVPDAVPTLEPIRAGGANKPYTVWGQAYVPLTADVPLRERGLASWYGRKFHGKPTASGELYDMYAMTAAHPTLPIPSYARIRNPENGREVVVRINDRGPFHSSRIVDLSYTAALKLDILRGVAPVELERITADDIRTGAWRRSGGDSARLASAASAVTFAPPPPGRSASVPPPADPVAATDVAAPPAPLPTAAVPPAVGVAAADTAVVGTAPGADAAAPARIESAAVSRAVTATARGFWVQLGAFRRHDGATLLQREAEARVDGIAPLLTVFGEASLYRLQAGPYPSRDEARDAAERLRIALGVTPLIVERR